MLNPICDRLPLPANVLGRINVLTFRFTSEANPSWETAMQSSTTKNYASNNDSVDNTLEKTEADAGAKTATDPRADSDGCSCGCVPVSNDLGRRVERLSVGNRGSVVRFVRSRSHVADTKTNKGSRKIHAPALRLVSHCGSDSLSGFFRPIVRRSIRTTERL